MRVDRVRVEGHVDIVASCRDAHAVTVVVGISAHYTDAVGERTAGCDAHVVVATQCIDHQFLISRNIECPIRVTEQVGDGHHACCREADDIIAVLCKKYQNEDIMIVSADKDFIQLVKPNLIVYRPMEKRYYFPKDVKDKCIKLINNKG